MIKSNTIDYIILHPEKYLYAYLLDSSVLAIVTQRSKVAICTRDHMADGRAVKSGSTAVVAAKFHWDMVTNNTARIKIVIPNSSTAQNKVCKELKIPSTNMASCRKALKTRTIFTSFNKRYSRASVYTPPLPTPPNTQVSTILKDTTTKSNWSQLSVKSIMPNCLIPLMAARRQTSMMKATRKMLSSTCHSRSLPHWQSVRTPIATALAKTIKPDCWQGFPKE